LNKLVFIGVAFGMFAAKDILSESFRIVSSALWRGFRSQLKKGKYLIAIVLFLITIITFLMLVGVEFIP